MRGGNRKSAPKVRDGKVQKKNRTARSPSIFRHNFEDLVVRRMRPAEGYYHPVSRTDIRRFISILDDWETVSVGIRAVVLTPGPEDCFGSYYNAGVITLTAWWKDRPHIFAEQELWLASKMGIEASVNSEFEFTRDQARCFQLMATFLHEVGHHIDRMSTKSQWDAANGEPFAIHYEQRRQKELWNAYVNEFGLP